MWCSWGESNPGGRMWHQLPPAKSFSPPRRAQ